MCILSWSIRKILGRVTPLMELIYVHKDLCGTCRLVYGKNNALHFQSKLRIMKHSSKEMLRKNEHKLVCSTSLPLEVEQLVMFSVALLQLLVLEAVLHSISMDVLKANLLSWDKQVVYQPKCVSFLEVSERSWAEWLHSWSSFTYIKTSVGPASWVMGNTMPYTFRAN